MRRKTLVACLAIATVMALGGGLASAADVPSSLVNTIQTSGWAPPSPDPSGIAYDAGSNRLIVTDGEVDEMTIYAGVNFYEATLGGTLLRTSNTRAFSAEPTGVAMGVPGEMFMTNDDQARVQQITLGANGQFDASDTFRYFSTTQYGTIDAEGVTYDAAGNRLFIADGLHSEIWQISPGDGVFGNSNDVVQHFDTAVLGIGDPETVEFNADSGTLFTVGSQGKKVLELTPSGALLRTIDISYLPPHAWAGITWAPRSNNPAEKSLYLADRALDNDQFPTENDGKIYEVAISGPPPPPNTPPAVSLTSPADGASFEAPATVNIAANASDADGSVSKVEFFNGATKLGEDTSAPYAYQWTGVAQGTYSITAKATDNGSLTTTSAAVSITVTAAPPPPNTPPAVSLTSPADGASFEAPATVNIAANASDADGSVSKVEFFNGATKLGEDTSAPYAYQWTGVAQGTYSITAKATDNGSLTTTSAAVSITVTAPAPVNQPPTASITSPANGASFEAPATVNIAANASDADGSVSKVEFFNGATKLGEDTSAPYAYQWTGVAQGTYSITAKATDNGLLTTTSAAVSITVTAPPPANQPPTASITSPANGASFVAPATVNIAANASDADGSVSKVEFFNGATKLGEDTSAPYTFAWTGVAQGTYSITAKATDNALLTTTSTAVSITVNAAPPANVPPTVSITSPTNGQVIGWLSNVVIRATAADSDGTVTKVEFYRHDGATKIGQDTTSPYSYTWSAPTGNHVIRAKAYDNQGAITTSASVSFRKAGLLG